MYRQYLLAFILILSGFSGIPALADDSAVVLMYHRFGEDRYPATNNKVEQFETQLLVRMKFGMKWMALAEGLKSYSERGQAYVDTLKGTIRANGLDIADNAVLRDEPMSFILGDADQAAAAKLRKDIEAMRKSGELAKIIERMRLE